MNPPAPGPVSGLSATQETSAAPTSGVHGVPSRGEHVGACLRGQRVSGCDRPSHA